MYWQNGEKRGFQIVIMYAFQAPKERKSNFFLII